MSIGITEVFAGDAVHFRNVQQEKYQLALQIYALSVRPEWLHTYSYAANELWGEKARFVIVEEKNDYVFDKHEGVVILARRKDGKLLTDRELADLRRQIVLFPLLLPMHTCLL